MIVEKKVIGEGNLWKGRAKGLSASAPIKESPILSERFRYVTFFGFYKIFSNP